jgi:hypothetical protein
MKDRFYMHACAFKNEADCAEELDELGLSFEKAERMHFEDE